jgi:hypothetical protein
LLSEVIQGLLLDNKLLEGDQVRRSNQRLTEVSWVGYYGHDFILLKSHSEISEQEVLDDLLPHLGLTTKHFFNWEHHRQLCFLERLRGGGVLADVHEVKSPKNGLEYEVATQELSLFFLLEGHDITLV